MAFPSESSLRVHNLADFFLAELIEKYPVSDKFLEGFIPRVNKIFEYEITDEQRESLLRLANKSIVRQSETETILQQASIALDHLGTAPSMEKIRSRRQRPVTVNQQPEEVSSEARVSAAG